MTRARDTKVTLPCTWSQKAELEQRAKEHGVTISNYLRLLLGWPPEQQGSRKDVQANTKSSTGQQGAASDACERGENS